MTQVTIKITSDCALWRADLHCAGNDKVIRLPNNDFTTKIELKPGVYYISFSSYANSAGKSCTITAQTTAANKLSSTFGQSANGDLITYLSFTLTSAGAIK